MLYKHTFSANKSFVGRLKLKVNKYRFNKIEVGYKSQHYRFVEGEFTATNRSLYSELGLH